MHIQIHACSLAMVSSLLYNTTINLLNLVSKEFVNGEKCAKKNDNTAADRNYEPLFFALPLYLVKSSRARIHMIQIRMHDCGQSLWFAHFYSISILFFIFLFSFFLHRCLFVIFLHYTHVNMCCQLVVPNKERSEKNILQKFWRYDRNCIHSPNRMFDSVTLSM